jgi:hypothetical protein
MESCAPEGACPSGESLPNIDSAAEDATTAGDAPVTAGAAFTEEGALEAAEDATTAGDAPVTAGAAFTEDDDALVLTFDNFFDEEGALEAAEDAALMNSIPGCNL